MIRLYGKPEAVAFWNEGDTYHLDVREYLFQGGRPYTVIMACVRQVAAGDRLVIHAPFEPKPLREQVRRMGLAEETRQVDPEHWTLHVWRP